MTVRPKIRCAVPDLRIKEHGGQRHRKTKQRDQPSGSKRRPQPFAEPLCAARAKRVHTGIHLLSQTLPAWGFRRPGNAINSKAAARIARASSPGLAVSTKPRRQLTAARRRSPEAM